MGRTGSGFGSCVLVGPGFVGLTVDGMVFGGIIFGVIAFCRSDLVCGVGGLRVSFFEMGLGSGLDGI